METPQNKTSAFEIAKNYLPAIIFVGGLLYNVFKTWNDIFETKERLKDLDEKVAKQYGTQRIREDKTDDDIESIKDYIEFQKGYEQAKKDLKK